MEIENNANLNSNQPVLFESFSLGTMLLSDSGLSVEENIS
jgi:hypothetical protein